MSTLLLLEKLAVTNFRIEKGANAGGLVGGICI